MTYILKYDTDATIAETEKAEVRGGSSVHSAKSTVRCGVRGATSGTETGGRSVHRDMEDR